MRAKADAFVSEANRRANFGRALTLRVAASPAIRTYIRFDVDASPDSNEVKHVSLLLYSRTRSRAGYQVRLAEGHWNERRVNFVNAPALSAHFVGSGPLRGRTWKAVDITSLVVGQEGPLNLALTAPADSAEFASRETGLHGPRLVVETAPPETTRSSSTSTGSNMP
jgi:hypothetical protein